MKRGIQLTEDDKIRRLTHSEWMDEGMKRFPGLHPREWQFVCPVCGHVAKYAEWLEVDAEDSAAFSCIGRWRKNPRGAFEGEGPGPCNYAGGGLFRVNPVLVTMEDGEVRPVFEWAI